MLLSGKRGGEWTGRGWDREHREEAGQGPGSEPGLSSSTVLTLPSRPHHYPHLQGRRLEGPGGTAGAVSSGIPSIAWESMVSPGLRPWKLPSSRCPDWAKAAGWESPSPLPLRAQMQVLPLGAQKTLVSDRTCTEVWAVRAEGWGGHTASVCRLSSAGPGGLGKRF